MQMRGCQEKRIETIKEHLEKGKDLNYPTAADMGFAEEPFRMGMLSVTVLGASGDLSKKETYPALLDLFAHDYLPPQVAVVGFGRPSDLGGTIKDSAAFREWLKPWLQKSAAGHMPRCQERLDAFLDICTYFVGEFNSSEDFARLNGVLCEEEKKYYEKIGAPVAAVTNRVFYFAIPPFVFVSAAASIKASARSPTGFTRLIVEKPFGRDLASANALAEGLTALHPETDILRMDHFLGYELCQNILFIRFGNAFIDPLLNRNYVACVRISLKENFGTTGRGGYFTKYGIIRDVIQNHLLQMLTLIAMEKPSNIGGSIRDAKVAVLNAMQDFDPNEVILGQFTEGNGNPGFLDDDSIAASDREVAQHCATFAQMVIRIDNDRWRGVPFIIKAGKGLKESKCEVRIQFNENHSDPRIFKGQKCPRNELVIHVHPNEAIWMRTNVKSPGLSQELVQSELDLSYTTKYGIHSGGVYCPDAYTRLILAGIRGDEESFVRSDELLRSWQLFTPFLESIEGGKKEVIRYPFGSRGPKGADEMLTQFNFMCSHAVLPGKQRSAQTVIEDPSSSDAA
jgi:glucose-6-phosphate 1-dehydrogenase